MRGRKPRDVLRDPEPEPLHLDRLPFTNNVVVDAGTADLRPERLQRRMAGRGRGIGRRRPCRRARHPDAPVGPFLPGYPLERIPAVGRVVRVDAVFALGAETPPRVLIDRGVPVCGDVLPAAQDRPPKRFVRRGQPALGDVVVGAAVRARDPVGCALQDHRKPGAACRRQKYERVQTCPVAHRDHGLMAPRAGIGIDVFGQSSASRKQKVRYPVSPAAPANNREVWQETRPLRGTPPGHGAG